MSSLDNQKPKEFARSHETHVSSRQVIGAGLNSHRPTMPTLQQQIADAFLTRLAASKDLGPTMLERLRQLMASGKKPKADDFIKVFSAPPTSDLK